MMMFAVKCWRIFRLQDEACPWAEFNFWLDNKKITRRSSIQWKLSELGFSQLLIFFQYLKWPGASMKYTDTSIKLLWNITDRHQNQMSDSILSSPDLVTVESGSLWIWLWHVLPWGFESFPVHARVAAELHHHPVVPAFELSPTREVSTQDYVCTNLSLPSKRHWSVGSLSSSKVSKMISKTFSSSVVKMVCVSRLWNKFNKFNFQDDGHINSGPAVHV